MMGLIRIKCCLLLAACFSLFVALSASNFVSDGLFLAQVVGQRRLLQVTKPCPVNFETQNYTVITSQCKAPEYSPKLCCSSFKEFACPFADELNDLTNDCAQIMFSYINRNGDYPNGLFASLCREGKEGLSCPDEEPSSSSTTTPNKDSNNGSIPIIGGRQIKIFALLLLLQFTCYGNI